MLAQNVGKCWDKMWGNAGRKFVEILSGMTSATCTFLSHNQWVIHHDIWNSW
jgi:hypothetical protein